MDCDGITELEQQQFAALITKVRRPYKALIEVTQRCNNCCRHCYLDPAGHVPPPDLPTEYFLELFDALAAEETLWLTLTGGEPLTRSDFPLLYEQAKRRGFLVGLFTNACLITDEIADLLAQLPPRLVSISLYGATAPTYESITCTPGSFDQAIAGIHRVHERGIHGHLKTVLMRSNAHELEGMQRLAEDLGWKLHIDALVQPTIYGSQAPLEDRLSPEEALRLDTELPERREAWLEVCEANRETKPIGRLYPCAAGHSNVFISATGQVHPCLVARSLAWPLDRDNMRASLHSIFYDSFPDTMSFCPPGPFACGECEAQYLCVSCPACRELETGSAALPCAYNCRLTQLRTEAFGVPHRPPRLPGGTPR